MVTYHDVIINYPDQPVAIAVSDIFGDYSDPIAENNGSETDSDGVSIEPDQDWLTDNLPNTNYKQPETRWLREGV